MIRKPKRKLREVSEERKLRRKLGIRKKIAGTAQRPRIVPYRSNKNLSVQVIDDVAGKTLVSVQTFGKNGISGAGCTKDGAEKVGKALAEKMSAANIKTAVFDRSGYRYHGVIKTLADSVREGGIQF